MSAFKSIFLKFIWCITNFNSRNWFYKLIALIGFIVRVGLLPLIIPNIFDVIAEFFISQLGLPKWAYEVLIRIALFIIEKIGIYHLFYYGSFLTVGCSYESGSCPAWGSVCYTLYYIAYMAIPIFIFQFFLWWVILLTFIGYILLCAAVYLISAKFDTLPDIWKITICIHSFVTAIIFAIAFTLYGVLS